MRLLTELGIIAHDNDTMGYCEARKAFSDMDEAPVGIWTESDGPAEKEETDLGTAEKINKLRILR